MEGLPAKELRAKAGLAAGSSPDSGKMEQRTVRVRVVTGECTRGVLEPMRENGERHSGRDRCVWEGRASELRWVRLGDDGECHGFCLPALQVCPSCG